MISFDQLISTYIGTWKNENNKIIISKKNGTIRRKDGGQEIDVNIYRFSSFICEKLLSEQINAWCFELNPPPDMYFSVVIVKTATRTIRLTFDSGYMQFNDLHNEFGLKQFHKVYDGRSSPAWLRPFFGIWVCQLSGSTFIIKENRKSVSFKLVAPSLNINGLISIETRSGLTTDTFSLLSFILFEKAKGYRVSLKYTDMSFCVLTLEESHSIHRFEDGEFINWEFRLVFKAQFSKMENSLPKVK